jgi:hypothetical protein
MEGVYQEIFMYVNLFCTFLKNSSLTGGLLNKAADGSASGS